MNYLGMLTISQLEKKDIVGELVYAINNQENDKIGLLMEEVKAQCALDQNTKEQILQATENNAEALEMLFDDLC